MNSEILDVVSPVETPNGKTIWMKLGVAFKGDPDGKYLFKMSLMALPTTAFSGEPLEIFIFKPTTDSKPKSYSRNQPDNYGASPPANVLPPDDDIPF